MTLSVPQSVPAPTLSTGEVRDHLAGAFSASRDPSAACRSIARSARRLGVELHELLCGSSRVLSPLPGDAGAALASTAALQGTPLTLAWLVGSIEDRLEVALRVGRSVRHNDAELVAAAWSEGGPLALNRVYGNYAFVAVERSGRVLAAVTPGGQAKLYCTSRDEVFAWSTHPLFLTTEAVECDPEYFRRWFGCHHPGDRTPYQDVRRIPGGQALEWRPESGVPTMRRWWTPPVGTLKHRDPNDYERNLRSVLTAAVRRACGAEEQVVIALSAGIDSASVAACAADLVRRGHFERATGITLKTAEPLSDEAPLAHRMALSLGIDHQAITPPRPRALEDLYDDAGRAAFPSPLVLGGWHAALACAARALGAKTLLTGLGGEALASSLSSLWAQDSEWRHFDTTSAWSAIAHLGARTTLKSVIQYLRRRNSLLSPIAVRRVRPWLRRVHQPQLESTPLPRSVQAEDQLLTMAIGMSESTDRVYVAPTGIGILAPYRDRRVLEFGYSLPLWARINQRADRFGKTLARQTFREVPIDLSRQAQHLSLNHAVGQWWADIFTPGLLQQLLDELPPSLDTVIDRDGCLRAIEQMSDSEYIAHASDLVTTGVWLRGLRGRGWPMG